MTRNKIVKVLGEIYRTENIENGEFSYQQGLKQAGKNIIDYVNPNWKRKYKDLDLRFTNDKLSVLIETKDNFNKSIEDYYEQLNAYILYESKLTNNHIVAILANVDDDSIQVFYDLKNKIPFANKNNIKFSETKLKSFAEYYDIFFGVKNDKEKVVKATYDLNETLHGFGVPEKIRSQFVGTCLLALKNGLIYKGCSNKQIREGITEILENLLDNKDINKATKIAVLKQNVIESQAVREIDKVLEKKIKLPNGKIEIKKEVERNFEEVLDKIKNGILPYINDKNAQGQDILNLFFTTFNKYVGKADRNQAFSPDHIVKLMSKICRVNKKSYVLDPCAGSGAFCVRALTDALNDCETEQEKQEVKKHHIWGVEYEEKAYGLLTTNMLIHGDGNSNMLQGSCFELIEEIIDQAPIDVVLMNPPYNGTRDQCFPEYSKTWDKKIKMDPSKGLHYVQYVASKIKGKGKLAVLLPLACAIGNDKEILKYKRLMLQEHQLEAVLSLPNEIFYPGASVCACCMIFNLGEKHFKTEIDEKTGRENLVPKKPTFFGYFKDDGFAKKKNLGRIEIFKNGKSLWKDIEKEWFNLYENKISKPGLSVVKKIGIEDEWLAEAYMETDYSKLVPQNFEDSVKDYLAYEIKYSQTPILKPAGKEGAKNE